MEELTMAEVKDAINYNRRRLNRTQVRKVQILVGAESDGIVGPLTVEAIADWQEEQGLADDGKVGPVTWARMISVFDSVSFGFEERALVREEIVLMMAPTIEHESGGIRRPYTATNEDWERRGAFDTPRRDPKTNKRLSPQKRRELRLARPDLVKEHGWKAFWASSFQDDGSPGTHVGLSFGGIQYAQFPGSLGLLLKEAYAVDKDAFINHFPHHDELLEVTNAGKGNIRVRSGLGPNKRADNCMPVAGKDLWERYWVDIFKASGTKEFMIEAQENLAMSNYFDPACDICKQYGWTDQVSLAVVFDMCVQFGPGRLVMNGDRIDRRASRGAREYIGLGKQQYGQDADIMTCINVLSAGHRDRRIKIASQMNPFVRYNW